MTADTAQQEAQAALRVTSTDALLTKFAQLTHAMHEAEARGPIYRETAGNRRAQRDLIRAEILRRTGDGA